MMVGSSGPGVAEAARLLHHSYQRKRSAQLPGPLPPKAMLGKKEKSSLFDLTDRKERRLSNISELLVELKLQYGTFFASHSNLSGGGYGGG
mmetsp:Transcript_21526/g.31750  ORF Transcript_21526/g.31750 Transcript_21526/m.31750 type:complete len:91 (-) Transcript_21526:10-282(-)